MWLWWLFLALCAVLTAHFQTRGIARLNSFDRPVDLFVGGVFLVPILLGGGLRFWLAYVRHPWLALLLFFPGMYFPLQAAMSGYLLVPEFCLIFQMLSGVLFVAYLPLFVWLREAGPLSR